MIPTWEELEQSGKFDDYGSMYRHLCKLHVEAALKAADSVIKPEYLVQGADRKVMSKKILSAYPLTNIR